MAEDIEQESISNSHQTSALESNLFSSFKSSQYFSLYSKKLGLYIIASFFGLLFLFQIQSTRIASHSSSWIRQRQEIFTNSTHSTFNDCASKLRDAVTFLPLKDLRYSSAPSNGRTWFMSSLDDIQDKDNGLQYQQFPSQDSLGKVLCLRGNDTQDGSWNSYASAWPDALPQNSTLLNGTTFVSNNHYGYDNIYHGLSATMPFVAWHVKNQCATPKRWILYHWGELRSSMAPWVQTLVEATFGEQINFEKLNGATQSLDDQDDHSNPSCFEKVVVMRHSEGRMSKDKRPEVYDLMRCKARMYCNVSSESRHEKGVKIGMTMLMRDGARSFRNASIVISIFKKECQKVEGCRLIVAHSSNLTFCEQVELMSKTDIMVSPHGAQLTNMILMDRKSSVMEFFPKGWLKQAGVGQYIYHWLADWSDMKHQGAWRDTDGENCPYPEDDNRCFTTVFKNGKIGHNATYFSEWARSVILDFQINVTIAQSRSQGSIKNGEVVSHMAGFCGCS